jgi:hypothetical protein
VAPVISSLWISLSKFKMMANFRSLFLLRKLISLYSASSVVFKQTLHKIIRIIDSSIQAHLHLPFILELRVFPFRLFSYSDHHIIFRHQGMEQTLDEVFNLYDNRFSSSFNWILVNISTVDGKL